MVRTLYLLLFSLVLASGCSHTPQKSELSSKELGKLHLEMGTASLTNGEYPEAIESLRRALQYDSSNAIAHNHLGLAYYALGKKQQGKQEILRSVTDDPNYSDAYINLGNFAVEEKNYVLAKHYYTKALDNLEYKYRHRAFTNLGQLALLQGNIGEAKQYLSQSMQANPDFCMTHFLFGAIYSREGNPAKAAQSFQKSIAKNCVNKPENHYQLGLAYMKMKNYSKAREQFVFLVQEFPQTMEAQGAGEKLKDIP